MQNTNDRYENVVDPRGPRKCQVLAHWLRRSVPHGRMFPVPDQGQGEFVFVARQARGHVRTRQVPEYDAHHLGRHAQTFVCGHHAAVRHWQTGRTDGKFSLESGFTLLRKSIINPLNKLLRRMGIFNKFNVVRVQIFFNYQYGGSHLKTKNVGKTYSKKTNKQILFSYENNKH